jgi:hypothetical protein
MKLPLLSVLLVLPACGGGGATTPTPAATATPAPQPTSWTFTGETRSSGVGACSGDSHQLEGVRTTVEVTLVSTSPGTPLIVQVCAPSAVDHSRDCSVNRQVLETGRTVTAPVVGGSTQVLVLHQLSCGTQPVAPTAPAVGYQVAVTTR